jgi:dihydroorotase-like cyclic amidohydrolase
MGLLIRNGEIVTADSRCVADIYAEDETITRIGKNLEVPPGTEIVDASGKFVFPGFIDPHVQWVAPPPTLRCAVPIEMTTRSKAIACGSPKPKATARATTHSTCP